MRRVLPVGAIVVAVLVVLGLLALSPFALQWLGAAGGLEWGRLSAIGETYGAVATLVTALSLGGIALSLLLQAKDAKTAREQTTRMFHFDLVRMKLDDPKFLWAAGWPRPELMSPVERTTDRIRQHLYVNMWVYYWLMLYEMDKLTEANLRALLAYELFNGEVGRQYWASTGGTFSVMSGRRTKRFFRIVEEEYQKVIESGRPAIPATGPESPVPEDDEAASAGTRWPRKAVVGGGAVVLAGLAGYAAGITSSRLGRRP